MNKIKRQLSITDSSSDRKHQLQKSFDETNKSIINCLENLSNEIFYEIFEYLDGCDIFRIFSKFNSRFRYLLNHLSIPLKFNLLYEVSHSLLPYYETIVLANKHRIISLYLNRIVRCNLFSNSIIIDSSFNHLESLTLSINDIEQLKLFENLSSVPCLFALTVYLSGFADYNDNIYIKICSLPKLKYAKISSEASSRYNQLRTARNNEYTPIENLIIDHNCTLDTLFSILSYTPRLLRLTCNKKLIESYSYSLRTLINKSILTHISINECSLKFTEFEIFIREISFQLKLLRISTLNDVAYLNANQWEQLICKYLPHLSILEFKYTEFIDKKFRITLHHKIIHQFTSSFWIERRWFLQYRVGEGGRKGGLLSYIIRPYRYNEKNLLMNKFINQYESNDSLSIQLTIVHLASLKWSRSFIGCIKPVLSLFNITRLVFGNHGIFIRTLLELIRMLPNLDSLIISSFASFDKNFLFISKNKTSGSKVNTNKITKVHLGRVTVLDEVQFLIHLCPYIHYLEMDNIGQINFIELLQLILITYRKNISDYFSLYLRNFQFDDKTNQQLQSVINNEKLHDNCSFTHIYNNVYLQYKKC